MRPSQFFPATISPVFTLMRIAWSLMPSSVSAAAMEEAACTVYPGKKSAVSALPVFSCTAPGVSFEVPARGDPPLDAAACRALAARLPDPATAPVDAYRRFQTHGFAELSEAERAAIDARLGGTGGLLERWNECMRPGVLFAATPSEAEDVAAFLGRGSELALLGA